MHRRRIYDPLAGRLWHASSLLASDVLVDGHVFLEAGEAALPLHGGEVLGLEVHDALLVAYAVRLVQVLGGGEETIGFRWRDRVHDFYYYC